MQLISSDKNFVSVTLYLSSDVVSVQFMCFPERVGKKKNVRLMCDTLRDGE